MTWTTSVHAQDNDSDKMIFLRLRLKNDVISLIGKTIRHGKFKQSRLERTRDGIRYTITSSTGESLATGFIEDPSLRRYEYEDSTQAGHIKTKVVEVPDVEFTLRIPVRTGMQSITFDRLKSRAVQQGQSSYQRIGSIRVTAEDN
ncbi:MAG TPA: hypothetical protein VJ508_18965 [Saprospiraceae bacterium]|nr:hypothetical protein [Saprospiraceae bacterium]